MEGNNRSFQISLVDVNPKRIGNIFEKVLSS